MVKRTVHGARIEISCKSLLAMLDFEGGHVHRIYTDDEFISPGKAYVLLEHPDLPELALDEAAPVIRPTYRATYGDNGCLLRIERIYPPKGGK